MVSGEKNPLKKNPKLLKYRSYMEFKTWKLGTRYILHALTPKSSGMSPVIC